MSDCLACKIEAEIGDEENPHPVPPRFHTCEDGVRDKSLFRRVIRFCTKEFSRAYTNSNPVRVVLSSTNCSGKRPLVYNAELTLYLDPGTEEEIFGGTEKNPFPIFGDEVEDIVPKQKMFEVVIQELPSPKRVR